MKKRIEKITVSELERLCSLAAMAPLSEKPIDEGLRRKGWVQTWDDTPGTVEIRGECYRKTLSGIDTCILFNDNGSINKFWLLDKNWSRRVQ